MHSRVGDTGDDFDMLITTVGNGETDAAEIVLFCGLTGGFESVGVFEIATTVALDVEGAAAVSNLVCRLRCDSFAGVL